jgi:hypothetical protein
MTLDSLAFISFFVIWLLGPPVCLWASWKNLTGYRLAFNVAGVVAAELLLFMALAFMHGITHGGILRWDFWF